MSSFVRTACTPCCTVVSSRSHWRRSAALVSCSARSLFCADRTSARSCASTAANAVVRSSSVSVRGDGATDQDASFVPRRGSDLLNTFGELLNEDASWGDFEFQEKKAAWFALSYAGRSVGSGTGSPDFLELLGSLLPPRDFDPPAAGAPLP